MVEQTSDLQDREQLRLLQIFHYIWGASSLFVLNRPSVRALFQGQLASDHR
jgi:hypothetical protein